MIDKTKKYFINNPIFIKAKTKFNLFKLTRIRRIKKVNVNERIVEMPFVFNSLPTRRNLDILDLGCTESSLSLHMASLGYKVVGVDMREFPYRHPNFKFSKADIMDLGFKDKSFDVVSCISTLEHIGLGFYKDRADCQLPDKKALNEIYRVLKDDGLLILSVPFGVYQESLQQRIYDLEHLDVLLDNFSINIRLFFADFKDQDLNFWREIDQDQAKKMKSSDGTTNCICLIKAAKANI